MLKKLLSITILISFSAFSQSNISGKMIPENIEFSWVAMYQLKGAKQLFVKNVTIENGAFNIELPADTPVGMYRLRYKMDNTSNIDIIFKNNDIEFSFDPENPKKSLKFTTSEENKIYNQYLQKTERLKEKLSSLQMTYFSQKSESDKTTSESLYTYTLNEFNNAQIDFEERSSNTLANHFIRAGNKYFNPLPFKNPQEYLNSEKAHFFDFIDFNDPALLNSTFISENVLAYILYLNVSEDVQVQNALYKKGINDVMAKIQGNDSLKSELIITLLHAFSQSENVVVMNYLKDNYYDKLPEIEKKPQDIKTIFDTVKLAVGKTAPDFEYEENGEMLQFHNLDKAPIYILAFWSSSCPHCVAEIPELYEYTKNNDQIHVVDIGLEKTPEEFKKLTATFKNWTNVLALEKWENPIARRYDIVNTPTYFILNADKKIIAKPDFFKDIKAYFEQE